MVEIIVALAPVIVPLFTAIMQIINNRQQKKLAAKVDSLNLMQTAVAQATGALSAKPE